MQFSRMSLKNRTLTPASSTPSIYRAYAGLPETQPLPSHHSASSPSVCCLGLLCSYRGGVCCPSQSFCCPPNSECVETCDGCPPRCRGEREAEAPGRVRVVRVEVLTGNYTGPAPRPSYEEMRKAYEVRRRQEQTFKRDKRRVQWQREAADEMVRAAELRQAALDRALAHAEKLKKLTVEKVMAIVRTAAAHAADAEPSPLNVTGANNLSKYTAKPDADAAIDYPPDSLLVRVVAAVTVTQSLTSHTVTCFPVTVTRSLASQSRSYSHLLPSHGHTVTCYPVTVIQSLATRSRSHSHTVTCFPRTHPSPTEHAIDRCHDCVRTTLVRTHVAHAVITVRLCMWDRGP